MNRTGKEDRGECQAKTSNTVFKPVLGEEPEKAKTPHSSTLAWKILSLEAKSPKEKEQSSPDGNPVTHDKNH